MNDDLWTELAGESDPRKRHRMKARAFGTLASIAGESWTGGPFRVTVTGGPFVDLGRRVVSVTVRVDRDGLDVTPATMNPLLFLNLPILVPDPAGDVNLGERGRFRVDLRASLLAAVREAVGL